MWLLSNNWWRFKYRINGNGIFLALGRAAMMKQHKTLPKWVFCELSRFRILADIQRFKQ